MKAVYGIIAYTGKQWTVMFEREDKADGTYTTGSRTGYGSFPFHEYPGLPVIDYTDNEAVIDKLRANIECIQTSGNTSLYTLMPLADFLQWHRDHSIAVL